jgi:formylglycine-generating enzyme required for sulfatase activity
MIRYFPILAAVCLITSTSWSLSADVNGDGRINNTDLFSLASDWYRTDSLTYPGSDIDSSGTVDSGDILILAAQFGTEVPATPTPTPTPTATINPTVIPGELVSISAGFCFRGNRSQAGVAWPVANASMPVYPDEQPAHWVHLTNFSITRSEITRSQYRGFINASGYSNQNYWSSEGWITRQSAGWTEPESWIGITNWGTGFFSQTDNHPVVGVSYWEAEAFANWYSTTKGETYRLPTEAQWERAARWASNRTDISPHGFPWQYSWGDEMITDNCNNRNDSVVVGARSAPPGSYLLGSSPAGCLDMAGNLSEWCFDYYKDIYYASGPGGTEPYQGTEPSSAQAWLNPTGPDSGVYRAVRGGHWDNLPNGDLRSAARAYDDPSERTNQRGFRLVRVETPTTPTPTFTSTGTPTPTFTPTATPTDTPAPGASMVRIAAGFFLRGDRDSGQGWPDNGYNELNEKPAHWVWLPAYDIGSYEVTNGEYRQFCDQTSRDYPADPGWARYGLSNYFTDFPNYPVVNINYDDAVAFCGWLSAKTGEVYRLPTEAEWEKAAGWNSGDTTISVHGFPSRYPWGEAFETAETRCNWIESGQEGQIDGFVRTAPAVSFVPGNGFYGVANMAGNVREWCSDWYDRFQYNRGPGGSSPYSGPEPTMEQAWASPTGPVSGSERIVRGGSWFSTAQYLRASQRDSVPPTSKNSDIGLRVVREVR